MGRPARWQPVLDDSHSPAETLTPYVLLERGPADPPGSWSEVLDPVGRRLIVRGRDDHQAVREALRLHDRLARAAQDDPGIELLAVPLRSFNPLPVRLRIPNPIFWKGWQRALGRNV